MKVKYRLMSGNLIIVILLSLISVAALVGMKVIEDKYVALVDDTMQGVVTLREVQYYFTSQANDERGLLLTGQASYVDEIKGRKPEIDKRLDSLGVIMTDAKEKQLLQDIHDGYEKFNESSLKVVSLYQSGNVQAAQDQSFGAGRDIRKGLENSYNELVDTENNNKIQGVESSKTLYSRIFVGSSIALLLAFIFAIIMSLYNSKKIVGPLKAVTDHSGFLANGDLGHSAETCNSQDELGDLSRNFNKMSESLKMLVSNIKESATLVASTSEELTASTEQHAQASEHVARITQEVATSSISQSQSIQVSSTAMDDIANQVRQITENSKSVTSLSKKTELTSNEGMATVTEVVSQMGKIDQSTHFVMQSIQALTESFQKISSITNVITGIAEQTNLLALNAAIEAARAGEHGKGFSVVADEVRKLAEQSRKSADDISALITANEKNLVEALNAMNTEVEDVKRGIEKVNISGQAFESISQLIEELYKETESLAQTITIISDETEEIVGVFSNINTASLEISSQMQSASASIEEQNASIEEISSASQDMSRMADELLFAVDKFKL
ncbi:methyl-accepting chemotaxis protein [Desulfitobacterium metallireducens]|nr:methyl-accepting chemotaxis protein [Desulfitobacterium metallireducens]